MDSSTTKVSKSVARKINHYLNKERVESEYDPSGKGIHTTNPLMANYELAYLVTTEDDNMKSLLTEKDQCSEGEMLVLPCLVPSAQCKSHVRRSDAKRVTNAARQVINSLPVKEIDMIRRYRPACRTTDSLEKGKVSQMSRNVHAMLNTKEAVDFAVKRDKMTQKLRAKSAYQPLRRTGDEDRLRTGHGSDDQRRISSSAKPKRKKKLRQKYTELPFGPGNSSHIATWLSEQKEKEIKAMKKKEKQKKRAEKEAMIEKERRDKEEVITAMESLRTDDEKKDNNKMSDKSNDRTIKRKLSDKSEIKNEHKNTDKPSGRSGERKRRSRKHEESRQEKNYLLSSSSHSSTTNSEDVTDVQNCKEKQLTENKCKEEGTNAIDKYPNNKCNSVKESTSLEEAANPTTTDFVDKNPIRNDHINTHSENKDLKEIGQDNCNTNKDEDNNEAHEKIIRTQNTEETKKQNNVDETPNNTKESKNNGNGTWNNTEETKKNIDKTMNNIGETQNNAEETPNKTQSKKRRDSETSIRTVEYVRTESVVSLPRS